MDEKSARAVAAMVASLNAQLEGIDVEAISRRVAARRADEVAINSFGTAGTAGTLTGCFGTAGTFGSLGAAEVAEGKATA